MMNTQSHGCLDHAVSRMNAIAGRTDGNSTGVMLDSIPDMEPGPPELACHCSYCVRHTVGFRKLKSQDG